MAGDDRMLSKMQGFGRLAAFLEQHEGPPLEGVIAALNHAISPHTIGKEHEAAVREGYRLARQNREEVDGGEV